MKNIIKTFSKTFASSREKSNTQRAVNAKSDELIDITTAISRGEKSIIEQYVKTYGVGIVNMYHGNYNKSLLYYAVQFQQKDLVKYFLDIGGDVSQCYVYNYTAQKSPIQLSIDSVKSFKENLTKTNAMEIFELLLEKENDLQNLKNLLDYAQRNEIFKEVTQQVIEKIMKKGIRISKVDEKEEADNNSTINFKK